MITVGGDFKVRRVVPGAVDVIICQVRANGGAVLDPRRVPGMHHGIAADHVDVQPGQLTEIEERFGIPVADGTAAHQTVIGRIFRMRIVILAVGDDVVMDIEQLFLRRTVGQIVNNGGADAVEGRDVSLFEAIVI